MMNVQTMLCGIALGAVLGCTARVPAPTEPSVPRLARETKQLSGAGVIRGVVRNSSTGEAIANARVALKCDCRAARLFALTDERGIYSFAGLPGGYYTIRVLAGEADVAKLFHLPEEAKYHANFSLDPASDVEIELVIDKRLPPAVALPVGGRSTDCFVVELPMPIHFRTTVGNSLKDAVEQQSH